MAPKNDIPPPPPGVPIAQPPPRPARQAPRPPPDQAPGSDAAADNPSAAFLVGFLAPVLAATLFMAGHGAIDQPEPETGPATMWYVGTALVAAASVVSVRVLLHGLGWPYGVVGGVGVAVALWAGAAAETYGWGAVLLFLLTAGLASPLLPVVLGMLATGIATAIVGGTNGAVRASRVALSSGAGLAAGYGGAALYHLATLERQAAAARRAYEYEAPGAAFVTLALLLLGAAWLRRR